MKNRKFLIESSLAWTLLFLGLSQSSAHSFTLDAFTSFEGSNTFQSVTTAPFNPDGTTVFDQDTILDSTVFGGQRTIQVTKNSGSPLGTISLGLFAGEAILQSGVNGSSEIIWDGNDISNTPTDLTIDGMVEQKSIQLNVIALNLGTGNNQIQLNFELRDISDNVANISQLITVDISSPKSLYFAYQDRVESSDDAGGNIDLTQVDYIRFYTSDDNDGDDFTFDFLQTSETVPFEFNAALGIIISSSLIVGKAFKNKCNGV